VEHFVTESVFLLFGDAFDGVKGKWILGHKGASFEKGRYLLQPIRVCKFVDISKQLLASEISKRILDPVTDG
jgi:hypothetical protein